MKKAVQTHSRDEFKQDVWSSLADAMHYVATDFADDRGEDAVVEALRSLDEKRGTAGNRVYYLAVPPAGVRDDRQRARRAARERGLDAADRREAVRPRPRLRRRAERDPAAVVPRGGGLPDRPLPRQGDGAEHAGPPLRERDLRADLEPPVHRPRPDHRRRVDRRRGAGRVLRVGRRDPRHLPEPPAPAARADGDGAADRLHRRLGPQREGEGAPLAAHARAEVGRARPVRAGLRRGRGGARLPRGAGRRARLDDRDVRRRQALRRQLALGRHAVLRARRQADGAARDRRSRSSSSARRTRRSRRSRATACDRTCS